MIKLDHRQRIWLTLAIALAFFMEILDGFALNTSVPRIAFEFGINAVYMKAAIVSYLLSTAIFIPMSSYIAEKFGIKKTFIVAALIFLLSSIGCGLSLNLAMLVSFRILQGIGGAFLAPVARFIMVAIYKKSELHKGQAITASLASVAVFIAPLIGGALTTFLSWRYIFFINVPIALLSMVAVNHLLPVMPKQPIKRFDLLGFVVVSLAIVALMLFFDVLPSRSLTTLSKILTLIFSLLMLLSYCYHSKYKKYPLFMRQLWQQRTFICVVTASLLARLAFAAIAFLIPMILQVCYHYSAFQAGLMLMPFAIAFVVSRWLFNKPFFGARYPGKAALFVLICFCFLIMSLTVLAYKLSVPLLILQIFLLGAVQSLLIGYFNVTAYTNLDPEVQNQGITLNSIVIQLGRSFSVAIAAFLVIINTPHSLRSSTLIPLSAFHTVFLVEGVFILLSGLVVWQIRYKTHSN